jgi:hypothetical protein
MENVSENVELPTEIILKIMEYLDVQTFKNMITCCHTFNEIPTIDLINKNKLAELCNYNSYQEFYNNVHLWETNDRVGFSVSKYTEIIIKNIQKENIKTTQLLVDYFPYKSSTFNDKKGCRYLVHELMLTIYKLNIKCLKTVSELSFKRLITKHGYKKNDLMQSTLNTKIQDLKTLVKTCVSKWDLNLTDWSELMENPIHFDLTDRGVWVFVKVCAESH